MATDVTMPRLSDSMEEGTILRWLKRDGEKQPATVAPTLAGRCEAPITATEAGSNRWSRWRMLMVPR